MDCIAGVGDSEEEDSDDAPLSEVSKQSSKGTTTVLNRGGSSFFPRGGGGFDPTTMRSIVHEPRSGEPIFVCYFEPP